MSMTYHLGSLSGFPKSVKRQRDYAQKCAMMIQWAQRRLANFDSREDSRAAAARELRHWRTCLMQHKLKPAVKQ